MSEWVTQLALPTHPHAHPLRPKMKATSSPRHKAHPAGTAQGTHGVNRLVRLNQGVIALDDTPCLNCEVPRAIVMRSQITGYHNHNHNHNHNHMNGCPPEQNEGQHVTTVTTFAVRNERNNER